VGVGRRATVGCCAEGRQVTGVEGGGRQVGGGGGVNVHNRRSGPATGVKPVRQRCASRAWRAAVCTLKCRAGYASGKMKYVTRVALSATSSAGNVRTGTTVNGIE